ncbi:preprotein translocase subunit SecG [Candidatus Gracilibacteria bacterium]|nr:MAG: preprotein translocase subunit SecG [Candidatus Gracilibacteria bacterium]
MIDFLMIIEVIISMLLIFFILIQNKNVTLNLASMSGGMGEITKRGPEKVMHNLTIALGTLFIVNSLALFILSK